MIRGVMLAVVVVVASVAGTGVVSADGNDSPLAAAGLDQTVSAGTVVYLDAGGSVDPDGSIESYRWEITTPNGTTRSPACVSCVQTHFRTNHSGEYAVTVTVTDDDGATASDTLYVTAQTTEPPSVTVTGPPAVQNGASATFDATVTAGDSELDTLVWSVNDSVVARQSLSGTKAERELNYDISTTGPRTVRARAVDISGASGSGTHTLSSNSGPTGSGTSFGPIGPIGTSGGDMPYQTDGLERQTDSGEYRMYLSDGGVFRSNGEVLFDKQDIARFDGVESVSIETRHTNNGPTDTLVIDNPSLKDAIDYDAGSYRHGFIDNNLRATNPNRDYGPKTKWQKTDPGSNYDRGDGKRLQGTKRSPTRVNKPGWEFVETVTSPTSQNYVAHSKRQAADQRIGSGTLTTFEWKDNPTGGEVVDTERGFSHYSWEETQTSQKRVKVGREKVGERDIYGFKEQTETKTGCRQSVPSPVTGETYCLDGASFSYTTTMREWGVVDTEPIYEPEYEYQMVEETVTKTSTTYPIGESNVNIHYDKRYKIKSTESAPLWQVYETKYKYNIYTYEWVNEDVEQ